MTIMEMIKDIIAALIIGIATNIFMAGIPFWKVAIIAFIFYKTVDYKLER